MLKYLSASASASIQNKAQQSVWRAAGADILPLPKLNMITQISLNLRAQLTCTAGNNSVANTKIGDEWALLQLVEIVANGSDVIFSMTGNEIFEYNASVLGIQPALTPTLGDGATANPTIDSTLTLPIWHLRACKPLESAMESYRYANLQLRITYGTFTDVNASASAFTVAPVTDVIVDQQEPTELFVPPFFTRLVRTVYDIPAASTQYRAYIDSGPYYAGFLMSVQANGGGNDLAGNITNVKLVCNATQIRDLPGPAAVRFGQLTQGINAGNEIQTTGIAYAARRRISTGSNPLAWTYFNLLRDGRMSQCVGSTASQDLYFELNAAAACRIVLIGEQVLPNQFYNRAAIMAARSKWAAANGGVQPTF